ncbi:C25 family cysteine peptidase [Bacteroides heparinolyticus]|uniref:C25 family cysteine peptidase n=5 Tax=Prevotella heparinolytica TaxID=28113 RepID=UPI0035A06477
MVCSLTIIFIYPFDLYYVAIDNSWDANKNGVYGESVDNADDHPDFYYGRAPVETVIEASTFVLKCKEYEILSEINPIERQYVNNIVGMQAYLSLPGQPHDFRMQKMEKLFDYVNSTNNLHSGISQNNIVKWRGYDPYDFVGSVNYENYHFNLSKNNALDCFGGIIPTSNDKRAHIVLHCDHSSYLSLGTSALLSNMTVDRNDILTFSNNPLYQILFTVGCSPGEYDKDCIVERFLNNASAGAVAVCASSQTSIVGEENMFASFIKDLYDYEENGVMSNSEFFKLGVIHSRAASSYSTFNVYIRKNHLFGDPELPIWTREPVDLSVSTTPSIITNQDNELTVNVSGMVYSGLSTNDVDVCVMKDNEIYLREHYDGTSPTHNFVFNITPETAGDLKVTVTGHNYIPYETTVPVNITGKNVYISNKTVLDATGNNDGNLDAGESANLSISLKNNGTVNLANVTATLSCEFFDENMNQNINEYLTLATPTVNYGTIAQNATVTKNDFQLALSNAIPDRTSLRCTLTISDGSGGISERSFTLLVRAPEIEYVSVRHMERPNGRIILDIELNNLGNGTAKGITATLASSDVQITEGMATYGEMSHLEAITRPFEFIPNGNGIDGNAFTLIVNDAYNKSWSFNLTLFNVPNTVENLTFENAEHSIKLNWDPVGNSRGYYVYRSMTSNGNYERLNRYPISSAFYSDLGMEVKHTYYYAVSYLDEHGNESGKALITAWTSLPVAEGWPVSIPDGLGRAWGTAPNVADIDGDGKQEIFLTTGTGDQQGNLGAIIGLNCIGEELYDIDHNPTTISGFANIHVSMTCTPAIADIDNDGIEEIVVATRSDLNGASHKLCVYKNRDADNDGVPDLAWERPIDYKNFNGVTLSDLDDDGFLEIIVPNQGNNGQYGYTYLEIFDCFGNYYYPKNTIAVINTNNHDRKAVTMAVVADFDNDGHKEIAFGLEGGVYLWRCGSQTLSTLVPCQGRMDCPIIAADIDNDENLEILYMVIKDKKGYIYAIKSDASTVSGWDDDSHFIPIKGDDLGWEWPPYFSVGDIDNDGSIEVFIADKGRLKMWGSDGAPFGLGEINIPDLDCRYFQPVIADVDGNGDCEIIIPSQNGYIYAFKSDGETVSGWPLTVADLATIPVVTDIDNDGYNEVVASSKTEIYVWHTEGESKYNHFDRFRYNKYNNAIYEIPCSYVETPIEIMGTQIWNDNRFVNRHVIINKGAHLTVKSELKFSEEAKIIVKPGGRLILDGCKLTSSCPDEMWQGIEVWGNKNTHQYAVNGQYSQGYVELRNGATIENAVCALALWRPGHWGTTGGIVHAEDAVFRNNHRAVHALHYRNTHPVSGKETGYNATFTRCQFTVDGNYPGDGDHVFHKHVDLDHVRGLKFRACDFSVTAPSENISQWTSGIAGYEAGFGVTGLCEKQQRASLPVV